MTRRIHILMDSVPPRHLMDSSREVLHSVPRSNKPCGQKLRTSISSVSQILSLTLAVQDALAKSQHLLHFLQILWPLSVILLSGRTRSNRNFSSKVVPFGINDSLIMLLRITQIRSIIPNSSHIKL